jgi:hypothetical protein
LQQLAEKLGVAVVLVRHFTKDTKARAESRGGGSLGGFLGLARSGWLVEYHPESPGVLVFANYKNNLAREGESILYTVEPMTVAADGVTVDTAYVQWGDFAADMDADSVLRGRDSRGKAPLRDECMAAIEMLLDERDPYPAREIMELLDSKQKGEFKEDTIKAAKGKLKVRSVREYDPDTGTLVGWSWTRKPAEDE